MDFRIVQQDSEWYDTVGVFDGDELLTTYAVPIAEDLFEYVDNHNLDPQTQEDCSFIVRSFTESTMSGIVYQQIMQMNDHSPENEETIEDEYEHHLDELNGGYSHFEPKYED